MKKTLLHILLGSAGLITMHCASAANQGVSLGISTLGAGVAYTYGFTPSASLSVGYNAFDFNRKASESGVNYDGKVKLRTLELLGGYHPFQGSFAIQAGALYNDSSISANGTSNATSITINNVTYTGTAPQAHYESKFSKSKLSPYLGVGWSANPPSKPGLAFNARIGVLYQKSSGTLTVSGVTDSTGTLESNRAAAEKKLNDDVNKLKWYPVVGIGASYSF
ncbi:hypothetical protein [Uliginosibacterium sediminicola]|uniref:Outer membrane protein n=1 Tax=Uliginosibacterium sediminicola TaxID=2024550 RepID=A0ABU9Z164_9RHOO